MLIVNENKLRLTNYTETNLQSTEKANIMKENSQQSSVSERFKVFISNSDKKRVAIASDLSVRPQTIGDYCSGKTYPSAKVMTILAEKYGLNINWLLTGQGEMYADPLMRDFNPEYVYFGDTLRDILADENLTTTQKNFAEVGGITDEELAAILSNKMPPPATALRKWATRYRINMNFLIAQMGYPLLTKGQYEQRGPLTWLRERDGEWSYPGAAKNPDYAPAAEDFDSDFEEAPYQAKQDLPEATPGMMTAGRIMPLVGLAECGVEGWSKQMEIAATTHVPDFHEDMIAAMAIGDSMEPVGIRPGNIVYADPRLKPKAGDIVYVERRDGRGEGTATVKIYQEQQEGWLHLCGWLPKKYDENGQKDFCIKEKIEFVDVIAPVVMIRKRAE